MSIPTAVVGFSGGGVMDYGLRQHCEIIGAVDREPWALLAYKFNHVGVPTVQADLVTDPVTDVLSRLGIARTDYAHFSPPCGPWSKANFLQRGTGSDRFALLAPLRYLELLRPRIFSIENVDGLMRFEPGPEWAKALVGGLERLGYRTAQWSLNALDFGVPQRRKRWFLVGTSGRRRLPPQPRPTHGGSGQPPHLVLRDAIGGISERLALAEGVASISEDRIKCIARTRPGGVYPGRNKSRLRRPSMDNPSGSLTISPDIHCRTIAHPTRARALSVVEYTQIMAVPEYLFPDLMPLSWRYRVIGEGNPPVVMETVVRALMRAI